MVARRSRYATWMSAGGDVMVGDGHVTVDSII